MSVPASGFITYENLLLAYYNGVAQDGVNNNNNIQGDLATLRSQLTGNGVNSSALTKYENLLVAQNNNMIGAKYDGDNTVNNAISAMRLTLVNSYTGS